MKLVECEEQQDVIKLTVRPPSRRYVDELMGLKCGPTLLLHNLYPNGKELTESFAAYSAVRKHLAGEKLKKPDVHIIDVGCGVAPRNAALFALRSAWMCTAVDPRLKWDDNRGIRRLEVYPHRIEDVLIVDDRKWFIVVAVHSHVRLETILASLIAPKISVVALPCCVPQELDVPPDIEYEDSRCWSPQRTVKIWKDYRGQNYRSPCENIQSRSNDPPQ